MTLYPRCRLRGIPPFHVCVGDLRCIKPPRNVAQLRIRRDPTSSSDLRVAFPLRLVPVPPNLCTTGDFFAVGANHQIPAIAFTPGVGLRIPPLHAPEQPRCETLVAAYQILISRPSRPRACRPARFPDDTRAVKEGRIELWIKQTPT